MIPDSITISLDGAALLLLALALFALICAFGAAVHWRCRISSLEQWRRLTEDTLLAYERELREHHRRLGCCDRPPTGWMCPRERDHDGPCAAYPVYGEWFR